MRMIPVTLAVACATDIIRQYPRSLIRFAHSSASFQSASRLYYWLRHLLMVIIRICDLGRNWEPSNDVSYVGLSQIFIISTRSWFEFWAGVISPEGVGLWQKTKSVISKSRAFQWCIICEFISKFHNLHMFKVWGLRWYNFICVCRTMIIIKISDLQVKSFPMMYYMCVYLKLLWYLHV